VKEALSYLLAFAGLGMTLWAYSATAGRLRYLEARPMIIHLLRTNGNQAELMARGGKTTFLEAVAAAIKTAAMMKTTDIAIIASATKPAYDASLMPIGMHWKAVLKRVRTGAMLTLGGVVMAIAVSAFPLIHILIAITVFFFAGYIVIFKIDVDRSLLLARAEVLPEVEHSFASGRYVLPP
jgi:hypothetical protein